MGIINKIWSLIKKNKINVSETKIDLVKEFGLNPNIGLITSNCPYCGLNLEKFPSRKTKCKNCGNYFYVRTRYTDKKKIIIKEEEIKLIEQEYEKIDWDKKRYLEKQLRRKKNKKTSENKKCNLIGLDFSKEIKQAIEDFKLTYKEICDYPEINLVDEEDKLSILLMAWENSNYLTRDMSVKMSVGFPQYEKNILKNIFMMESARVNNYCNMKQYLKELKPRGLGDFVGYYNCEETASFYNDRKIKKQTWARLVHIEDMVVATNIHRVNNEACGVYCYTTPLLPKPDTRYVKTIFLYKNGEYIQMTIAELKEYCKNSESIYPLWLPPKENKELNNYRFEKLKQYNGDKNNLQK